MPLEGLWAHRSLAWVAALLHLSIGLWLLSAYGPTWDAALGDYAYGERILESLEVGGPVPLEVPHESALVHRESHPNFTLMYTWYQLYPFAATLSAASCRVLHDLLGWLPALSAHHLVVVLFGSLLAFALVRFAQRYANGAIGCAAVALLFTAPVFFAHGFNNLKDVPEACLYGCAAIAGWRAITGDRTRDWALLGVWLGCGLAQKPNVLFLPPQLAVFVLWWRRRRGTPPWRRLAAGTGLAALAFAVAYLTCSPMFWRDTAARLGTHFGEMMRVGNPSRGAGGVSWHGVYALAISTPLPMLLLAVVGAWRGPVDVALRVFLGIWLIVPVARTLIPGMRTFDGVRHFLEFYPPLALLAGCGLIALTRGIRPVRWRAPVAAALLLPGAVAVYGSHPNGVCWINVLGGSVRAQQEAGNEDATDFWGNTYWQGLAWLRERAEPGSWLFAPMNAAIVRCGIEAAPIDTVRWWDGGPVPDGEPATVYVMYPTRRNWYNAILKVLESDEATVVHEVELQGGVLLRVHRLAGPDKDRYIAFWRQEEAFRRAMKRIQAWGQQHPETAPELQRIVDLAGTGDAERVAAELERLLPAELAPLIADIVWPLQKR